jgi:hypothetical protein
LEEEEEGASFGKNSDREKEGRIGRPTYPQEKLKAETREEVMMDWATTLAKEAEDRQKKEAEHVGLGGCLGQEKYKRAWEEIGGLEIIKKGVNLHWNWKGPPTNRGVKLAIIKNQKEMTGYRKEVQEMLREGIIIETEDEQVKYFNSTFLLKKTEDEFRFILNASRLNDHLIITHFKMENIGSTLDMIRKGDLMIKFDRKSAYAQVPVAEEAQAYLGFELEGRAFVYRNLPF